MLNLSINHKTTHLPLKIARGTVEQRLQKAIEMNDLFLENTKDIFQKRDIPLKTYKSKLLKVIKGPISVDVLPLHPRNASNRVKSNPQGGELHMLLNSNWVFDGYTLSVPANLLTDKVSRMSIFHFMHENLHLLERIFNPKYNSREISLMRKGKMTPLVDFYSEEVLTTSELNRNQLLKIMKDFTVNETIDGLQYLRYRLIMDLHAFQYVEKNHDRFAQIYSTDSNIIRAGISPVEKYKLTEKINVVENLLKEILKLERAKK